MRRGDVKFIGQKSGGWEIAK